MQNYKKKIVNNYIKNKNKNKNEKKKIQDNNISIALNIVDIINEINNFIY